MTEPDDYQLALVDRALTSSRLSQHSEFFHDLAFNQPRGPLVVENG